jgi:hypothetical protein
MFERFLAGIFPPEEVVFKLRVFKSGRSAASVTGS